MTIIVKPPLHIAVVNKSNVPAVDFVWMVAGVAQQVREHLCPAWGLAPIEVAAYTDDVKLPDDVAGVIYLANTDGNPDSLGYHAQIGKLAYGFVDVDQTLAIGGTISTVLSHEVLEMALDQGLDTWAPGSGGDLWAVEASDPVEDLSYTVTAKILDQTRDILVSDFILPYYFIDGATRGDYLGRVKAFEITTGGYQIAKRGNTIVFLPEASARAAAKMARNVSRTARRGSGLGGNPGGDSPVLG